ncbi:hypothetical protein AALP_AA6G117500 [Arabis alpina]|uniref:Uncharacterized protein n=1 Tax=Arabis alpina TaxID=50452 RepID=A0A087GNM7_ARAAL|nr:hypothetical protein AALP_AA6G117500 [Arabis alpina]
MRGATPGIQAFNVPSIPIYSKKSRRLCEVFNRSDAEVTADPSAVVVIEDSEDNNEGISLPNQEENLAVQDGSEKVPSTTDAANMQRTDDASARGSAPGESNEPKGPSDASRSKEKGKVDLVGNKAEKRLRLRLKPTSKQGGFRPSRSIIKSGSRIISPYEAAIGEQEEQIKSLMARIDVDAVWKELDRQITRTDTCEISATTNRQSANDYAAQIKMLKDEKQKLEEEVKKRDVNLEAASAKVAKLRTDLEKSRLTEDCLRKELDEAHRRADQIASGNSAQSARHSSGLERIRSYLVTLHAQEEVKAQLCYRRGAQISLKKMVEAEFELPPGFLEKYMKEEKDYLVQIESFNVDSLGDETLFLTPPPPPTGPPRDVAS